MMGIYKMFFAYKAYSIGDKLNAIPGSQFSMEYLWDEVLDYNLEDYSTEWQVPLAIIQGKYDQHSVTSVAKYYFDRIEAPTKQYFEFEKSGHEPHLMRQAMYKEVLQSIIQ